VSDADAPDANGVKKASGTAHNAPAPDARDVLKAHVGKFPTEPGVYLMKNLKDKVIYVGKAKSLRARVRSYFSEGELSIKTRYLMMNVIKIEYILTKTEVEAYLLEASLIKKYRPRYNIRLKDDKAYPYIRLSVTDAFPRLYLARRVVADGAMYFGPYTSGLSVRETIRFLNKTFRLRDCSDVYFQSRKRPCIAYQIGQCTAPCVAYIDQEVYGRDVESVVQFLKGRSARIMKDLERRMKSAAGEERFESAARYRDSLQAIEKIWERQTVVTLNKDFDQDVVAFVGDARGTLIETLHVRGGRVIGSRPHFIAKLDCTSEGEEIKDWLTSFLNQYYSENITPDEILLPVDLGLDIIKLLQAVFEARQKVRPRIGVATGSDGKKLLDLAMVNAQSHFQDAVTKADQQAQGLEQIKTKFGLSKWPRRLECFDISHFQGGEGVASQVTFEDGLPKSEDYRRYRMKTVAGNDDFASMKEVLSRRFAHTEYEDPDLLVIDGGKGQLNAALAVLKELGRSDIAVVGMAKARTRGETSSEERFFLPNRQNPLTFPFGSQALHILVGLRDEAHRFAITYHRKLRGERTLASTLDEIAGLGDKKKADLLKHFGSVERLRGATIEELTAVPGIHRVLAERIALQLRESDEGAASIEVNE